MAIAALAAISGRVDLPPRIPLAGSAAAVRIPGLARGHRFIPCWGQSVHNLHALALSLGCAFLVLKPAVPVHEGIQLIRPTSSWDPLVHANDLTLTFLWALPYIPRMNYDYCTLHSAHEMCRIQGSSRFPGRFSTFRAPGKSLSPENTQYSIATRRGKGDWSEMS